MNLNMINTYIPS